MLTDLKDKEKLTVREASFFIGVADYTIYRWIEKGLEYIQGDNRKYILKKDLLEFKPRRSGRPRKSE